jgi:hypothetical protein
MPKEPIQIRLGVEGRLTVRVPYSPDHVAKIKTVDGRRWHQHEQHWTVPHTNEAIAHLMRLFGGDTTEVDPSLDVLHASRQEQRVPDTDSAMLERLGAAALCAPDRAGV